MIVLLPGESEVTLYIRLNVTGYRLGISYTCTALQYKPAFIATW